MINFEEANWWLYVDEPLRELMGQSRELLLHGRAAVTGGDGVYSDYSFVVFPAAKAYEGFLKKVFLDMGLIGASQYYGEHFRIGRALSPTLPKRYRAGWVYGKLVRSCRGDALPMRMWELWKRARNRTFHYFPGKHERLSLDEAERLVNEIARTMESSLQGCGLG